MKVLEYMKGLERFAPRSSGSEERARAYIAEKLTRMGVDFNTQKFRNWLPEFRNFYLKADGRNIECMPTAFRSGSIEGKNLISSMAVSGRYYEEQNINFNPYSNCLSLATFYRAPSVAIKRSDVRTVLEAEDVEGKVDVIKRRHDCANLIVGNRKRPKNIIIAHYDSVLSGALDNASGTAMLLELAAQDAGRENMLVFSGCEELSFDEPIYWGRGYRIFESGFHKEMISAKQIIVVDMVGSSAPGIVRDNRTKLAAFPVKDSKLFRKAVIVSVKGKEWMGFYHSAEDRYTNIKERFLAESLDFVKRLI